MSPSMCMLTHSPSSPPPPPQSRVTSTTSAWKLISRKRNLCTVYSEWQTTSVGPSVVLLSSHLSWSAHTDSICTKAKKNRLVCCTEARFHGNVDDHSLLELYSRASSNGMADSSGHQGMTKPSPDILKASSVPCFQMMATFKSHLADPHHISALRTWKNCSCETIVSGSLVSIASSGFTSCSNYRYLA